MRLCAGRHLRDVPDLPGLICLSFSLFVEWERLRTQGLVLPVLFWVPSIHPALKERHHLLFHILPRGISGLFPRRIFAVSRWLPLGQVCILPKDLSDFVWAVTQYRPHLIVPFMLLGVEYSCVVKASHAPCAFPCSD